MTQQRSGPGMVTLRALPLARLDEDTGRDPAVTAAHRRILDAWHASRPPIRRAGLELAVEALAGIWAEHRDDDPMWRR